MSALGGGEREFLSESLWLCECGHDSGGEHNGLGCYGRVSYGPPLVVCDCKRTDADHEASVEAAAARFAEQIATTHAAAAVARFKAEAVAAIEARMGRCLDYDNGMEDAADIVRDLTPSDP